MVRGWERKEEKSRATSCEALGCERGVFGRNDPMTMGCEEQALVVIVIVVFWWWSEVVWWKWTSSGSDDDVGSSVVF